MTAPQLIGDREKLELLKQARRDAIVAFAEYLTGRGPAERVLSALLPADVDWDRAQDCFTDLLHAVDSRGPDRSQPLPYEAEVDLNYMTGEWR